MGRLGSKAAFGRDPFFGRPFVDTDEWRDDPRPHRYVHGGFEDTETRFSFYFPPAREYDGRFVHMFQGGTGGVETIIADPGPFARLGVSFDMYFDFGAYAVESNQGHVDAGGVDYEMPGLRGHGSVLLYRANAESARFAAALAAEMYGAEPHHGYAFGGSGGGLRSVRAAEYAPGIYDGVVPFMIPPPILTHIISAKASAAHAIRHRLADVIDALEPGGSGDPYGPLTVPQRDALSHLFAMGYAKDASWLMNTMATGVETIIGQRVGSQEYVEAFWSEPGYAGADGVFDTALVDRDVEVRRVLTAGELLESEADDPMELREILGRVPKDMVVGFEVDPSVADLLFTDERVREPSGAGREFRTLGCVGDVVVCVPSSPLDGIHPRDEIHVDNRQFLAYTHFYRHHVDPRYPEFAQPIDRGEPRHPQQPWVDRVMDPPYFSEPPYVGRFAGKMILQQHLADGSACSGHMGHFYASLVRSTMGDRADDHFRLWLTEHAHHHRTQWTPDPGSGPAASTRIIDYSGCIEQGVFHVIDWVENGIAPPLSTVHSELDGQIVLAGSAVERKGIQPVASATANGRIRADVRVGEEVTFELSADMPPGAGRFVAAHVDFEGSGSYANAAPAVADEAVSMQWTVRHAFERPGTYFPAFRVRARRDGRRDLPDRSVENLARVRVVVS